jgi:hypothetical protein
VRSVEGRDISITGSGVSEFVICLVGLRVKSLGNGLHIKIAIQFWQSLFTENNVRRWGDNGINRHNNER